MHTYLPHIHHHLTIIIFLVQVIRFVSFSGKYDRKVRYDRGPFFSGTFIHVFSEVQAFITDTQQVRSEIDKPRENVLPQEPMDAYEGVRVGLEERMDVSVFSQAVMRGFQHHVKQDRSTLEPGT